MTRGSSGAQPNVVCGLFSTSWIFCSCEITAGLATEVSIPDHKRWIPVGMDVQYLKKATTDLTASCFFENVDWDNIDTLVIEVSVKDINEQEVMKASIKMNISDKS